MYTCNKFQNKLVIFAGKCSVKGYIEVKLLAPSNDQIRDLIVARLVRLSIQVSQKVDAFWLYLTICKTNICVNVVYLVYMSKKVDVLWLYLTICKTNISVRSGIFDSNVEESRRSLTLSDHL